MGQKVGRPCRVCHHERRDFIEARILAGDSFRAISAQLDDGPSRKSIAGHAKNCMGGALAEVIEAKDQAQAQTLAERYEELVRRVDEAYEAAHEKGDSRSVIAAVREATRLLDLPLKHQASLERKNETVELHMHPDFGEHIKVVVGALAPFPEARDALVIALSNRVKQP